MSHNLNYKLGKASFFSVKEKAWHRLGKILDNPPTSEEAIKEAQLDFDVLKKPNFIEVNGSKVSIHNSFSTVRTDTNTPLGINLTSKYKVVQNVDAFKTFDTIVGSKQAIFETAGALGNGEIIFITAKLPDYIKLPNKEDIVEKYLLLTNSHNGTSSLIIMLTPIRVVCNNTLSLALSGKSSHKISLQHNSNIYNKLDNAAELLGLINLNFKEMEDVYHHMSNIKLDDNKVKELVAMLLLSENDFIVEQGKVLLSSDISTKTSNTFDLALEAIHSGEGQDLYEGSGLWFFNGMSYYYQNVKNYTTFDKKMENLYYGTSFNKLVQTSNLILSL
jgi:phage/plasmid-like protein (TIGR03299 family)